MSLGLLVYPTCTSPGPGPYHGEGGSLLSAQPPHPAGHHDIAAHHTTHPSDVMFHHCSDIPSRAAATSSTAATLHDIVRQGPHHTPKAPQSSDKTVTSQHPTTSCCIWPCNIIFPFLPFPGCHSCTRSGRRQAGDVPQNQWSIPCSSRAAQGCQQCPFHGTSAPAVPLLWPEPVSPDRATPAACCCCGLSAAPSHTPLRPWPVHAPHHRCFCWAQSPQLPAVPSPSPRAQDSAPDPARWGSASSS